MSYISNPLMMTQGLMQGEKMFLLLVGKTYAAHVTLNGGLHKTIIIMIHAVVLLSKPQR